ncbi:hypothetical protein [Leifsonia aquatica]|uniref:hypothetical protein n=1 Tax=Leifsonia aquatica TaxID=144185 RepID=UPI00046A42FC|nr:hypothetical protein [Leifsonia aquatica]
MKDMRGADVEVGDKLVVAMREGNLAHLRIARVTGFGSRGSYGTPDPTVLVDWLEVDGWRPAGGSGYIFAKRMGSVLILEKGGAV